MLRIWIIPFNWYNCFISSSNPLFSPSLAGAFARTYDLLTAMTIVAVSVLLEEPRYLYHSGFLFSFGAILAIGVFLPVLEENLPGKKRIEKALSASLASSIAFITEASAGSKQASIKEEK